MEYLKLRTLVESDDLGPQNDNKTATVTITVTGENAEYFKKFMEDVAAFCNVGSSRYLALVDGGNNGHYTIEKKHDENTPLRWGFDGDGNTRMKVS